MVSVLFSLEHPTAIMTKREVNSLVLNLRDGFGQAVVRGNFTSVAVLALSFVIFQ
jgi:hypothetical protein